MAQLVHMDAHLDTFSDELCQVITRVGRIARRQVVIDGFIASLPPTLEASKDEDDNGDVDTDANAFDDEDDRDASSSSVDKIST